MVEGIRLVEKALGSPGKMPVESELEVRAVAERVLWQKLIFSRVL